MISFMTTNMIKFEKSIKDILRDVIKKQFFFDSIHYEIL